MRTQGLAILAILVLGAAASAHAAVASGGDTAIVLKATLTGPYLHTTSTGAGTATITMMPAQVCGKFAYHGLLSPARRAKHVDANCRRSGAARTARSGSPRSKRRPTAST